MSKAELKIQATPKQGYMLALSGLNEVERKRLDNPVVDEILWGGAAGGGKSEGLLLFCLMRRLQFSKSIGGIFRRTYKDLEKSLIRKTKNSPFWNKFAKWNEEKKAWLFPNGSVQEFGYIDHVNDLMNYDSAEYDDLCFDQLEHFPEDFYTYMKSRLRSMVGGDWPTLIRSTCNPGKVGHAWIKSYFVDACKDKILASFDEDLKENKYRLFIPAFLSDNTLMTDRKKAEYRSWLNQLPEADRRRLRDGDWDYVPGAALEELSKQKHGCKDMPVPEWATIICSYDFGFGKPFSIGWWWVDYDGRMFRFKEWYGWNGKPNTGLRLAASDVAIGILEREKAWGIRSSQVFRVANPDIFSKTPNVHGGGQGPSVAEIHSENGVVWNAADPARLLGKQQFHERLKARDGELPMAMFYESCEQFWRTVPAIPVDPNNSEDVDTNTEDHVYDDCKAAFMSRPLMPKRKEEEKTVFQKIIEKVKQPGSQADIYGLPDEIYSY